MANSIGKDKRTTNAARTSAASRAKTAGAAKQVAPKTPAPVESDVAVAEAEEDVEVLDVVPTDDDDMELDDDLAANDLAVSRSGAKSVVRREAVSTRGGFIGFLIRMVLRIPGARFVVSSAQELRKVTAPTPREAWNMTLIVVAMSAALALLLGAADLGLIRGLQLIVNLGAPPSGSH